MFRVENFILPKAGLAENLSEKSLAFTLRETRFLLTGKSGCGKSTLIKALLGLSPPLNGDVYFKDKLIVDWFELRKRICYLPQSMSGLNESFEGILEKALQFRDRIKDQETIKDDLVKGVVDIGWERRILKTPFSSLSGGEKQFLVFMLSIALKPEYFLIDEATTAMDTDIKNYCIEKITHFCDVSGAAFLWVSHDKELQSRLNIESVEFNKLITRIGP